MECVVKINYNANENENKINDWILKKTSKSRDLWNNSFVLSYDEMVLKKCPTEYMMTE